MKYILFLILMVGVEIISAARILFIIPSPAKSHYNLGDRLIEELVNKGHEVTIIASFKKSKPMKNLKEIVLPDMSAKFFQFASASKNEGRFELRKTGPLGVFFFGKLGEIMVNETLNFKGVQDLLSSNQRFDAVIGECFLIEGLLAGFSHRFQAPLIGIGPGMPNVWANELVGNPSPAAYIPDISLAYTDKMSFKERLINFLYTTVVHAHHYLVQLPGQDKIMRDHFGKNMPYIQDILSKTSLVLVNHHYSLAFPRPYVPNMIEIGSYHIKPVQPLPQDLKKFMDDAKNGVIYFSMGSNLRSAEFPKEKLNSILKVFSKLKQRVLWKFENENLPNLPNNVKVQKWMPQNDILAHPNVKLFITHGGLLSTTESVLRGVPVVGIPIFGDQPLNVKYIELFELGVKVDYEDLDKEQVLFNAIQEVLTNPKYTNNVKHRSKLLQDLPMSPIDTAIYWIEYVIRHKGAPHLISGAQELKWYQLYLIDVYAFLGVVVFTIVFLFCKLACCISKALCGKKKSKTSSSKKKN